MLRPIRRHVKDCSNYKKWDVDRPPNTKLKCPLIIVRYEAGPSGRRLRSHAMKHLQATHFLFDRSICSSSE
jgi:hypothetical protein